jgi:hypothetical protein
MGDAKVERKFYQQYADATLFHRAAARNTCGTLSGAAYSEKPCALRAPTVFLVRIRTIRTENTVMDKSKGGLG